MHSSDTRTDEQGPTGEERRETDVGVVAVAEEGRMRGILPGVDIRRTILGSRRIEP